MAEANGSPTKTAAFDTEPMPSRDNPASRNLSGIGLMAGATANYAVMNALAKWLGGDYPTMQVVFFRALFTFLLVGYLVWQRGGLPPVMMTRDPWGNALRCVFGLASLTLYFYCFARMNLADAVAISFAAPAFVTALSVPLLGEKVGLRRWSACLVGFAGVLVMVKPSDGVLDLMALLALLGTLCFALAVIFVRRVSRVDSSISIIFYYTVVSAVVSGATLPFDNWVTPSLDDLLLFCLLGLFGGVAQILMTNAFRLGEASLVAPFDYLTMLWVALLGWYFWQEVPGLYIWIGCAIVVSSGLYIAYREATLRKPRGIARRFQPRA
jgi:drug/metabolite transporter (DMT)-like permease